MIGTIQQWYDDGNWQEMVESTMTLSSARTSPGLRERKKRQTRDSIAAAALELFVERGYDAVTIGDVADRASVDIKTIYNYFSSKPDLVYHRFEAFWDEVVAAVRDRRAGESVLAAFSRFLVPLDGLLGDSRATAELQRLTQLIVESPALLAYENQVYARFTAELAEQLAADTGAGPRRIEPSVVSHALVGLHRSLVASARAGTMAGMSNSSVARGVRIQAKAAVGLLESGLGMYGAKGRAEGGMTR
jgi:AcrR family transcriptional regulator